MEQQYTCPFCWKDYTRFTIHEHYGCGVEPLEKTEVETHHNLDGLQGGAPYEWGRVELGALSEKKEVVDQESQSGPSEELQADVKTVGNELLEAVKSVNEAYKEEVTQIKAEPKKRGRKHKAVA